MYKIPCLYKGCEKCCPYRHANDSCKTTIHHLWWPKRLYRTMIRRQFRELQSNKIKVCRGLHDVLHLINLIPKAPDNETMKQQIDDANNRFS